MLDRVLAAADEIGFDTTRIRKVIDTVIGHKVRDLGIIEERRSGGTTATYSAQINEIEGNEQIVLFIKDHTNRRSGSNIRENYIPLRREAAEALLSILERDEYQFMRTATDCESRLRMEQRIMKSRFTEIINRLRRLFTFLPLSEFRQIDRIEQYVPLGNGKDMYYHFDISACIGKERNDTVLIIRFETSSTRPGTPDTEHSIDSYPFGAEGRENLRRVLTETTL